MFAWFNGFDRWPKRPEVPEGKPVSPLPPNTYAAMSALSTFQMRPTTKLEFNGSGFAAGTVRGARAWNVNDDGWLVGITRPQVWVSGVNEASCRKFVMPTMEAVTRGDGSVFYRTVEVAFPEGPVDHGIEDCQHGFYAYYEGSNDYGDVSRVSGQSRVSGVVEGFGRTVLGSRGFRCMKAKIVALTFGPAVTDARRERVLENYADVPVFGSFEEMVSVFPPDKGDDPVVEPGEWVKEP